MDSDLNEDTITEVVESAGGTVENYEQTSESIKFEVPLNSDDDTEAYIQAIKDSLTVNTSVDTRFPKEYYDYAKIVKNYWNNLKENE